MTNIKPIRKLPSEVARKIAAGEVIDRPNAIVRELLDNAIDSGATSITVEIDGGGIDCIRIADNGIGMSKDDLENCAQPHATSKISSEDDLLHLSTLGFRGEALASIAAVSILEIDSCRDTKAYKLIASAIHEHLIEPSACPEGTIVKASSLFADFPARRQFLKRPASEGSLCRQTFIEKSLPCTDISFKLIFDGKQRLVLDAGQTLAERFVCAYELSENSSLFSELHGFSSGDIKWSFSLIIGDSSVFRSDRRNISIYVNGRKINEYSLIQAIEYGAQGFFPNGTHPVACLFLQMESKSVDFNIHPAKKEARFKDLSEVHHCVSSTVKAFFHNTLVSDLVTSTPSDSDEKSSAINEFNGRQASYSLPNSIQPSQKTSQLYSKSRQSFFNDSYTEKTSCFEGSFFEERPQFNNPKIESHSHDFISSLVDGALSEPETVTNSASTSNTSENANSSNIHFIGSALGVFLLAEKDGVLYAIDQHAAHERILFDQIMSGNGKKQELLIPYVIETTSDEEDRYLTEIEDSLNQSGFSIHNCGEGRWEVYSVPINWQGTESDLQQDILQNRIAPSDILRSLSATAACRAAIKDGMILDYKTAENLVRDTFALPEKRCPHGRPVFTSITREELFALVKRT